MFSKNRTRRVEPRIGLCIMSVTSFENISVENFRTWLTLASRLPEWTIRQRVEIVSLQPDVASPGPGLWCPAHAGSAL
jgi:hypothetical protein